MGRWWEIQMTLKGLELKWAEVPSVWAQLGECEGCKVLLHSQLWCDSTWLHPAHTQRVAPGHNPRSISKGGEDLVTPVLGPACTPPACLILLPKPTDFQESRLFIQTSLSAGEWGGQSKRVWILIWIRNHDTEAVQQTTLSYSRLGFPESTGVFVGFLSSDH